MQGRSYGLELVIVVGVLKINVKLKVINGPIWKWKLTTHAPKCKAPVTETTEKYNISPPH